MAFRTPYKILEDEEAQALSRSRKVFLELIQPFNAAFRYVEDRYTTFRKQYGLEHVGVNTIICSILLAVASITAICIGCYVLLSPGETDILDYIDPLIGTGRGGGITL